MTALPDNAPFRFETSYNTRDGRPELHVSRLEGSRRAMRVTADRLFVICGLVGIACLFWPYTIALGGVTLGLTTFLWAMRERSQVRRKQYEHVHEPPQIVHVTLTESGFSMRGDDFFAEAKWSNAIRAVEGNDFLVVQSWRVPRLYVPIDELRRAGLYERIRAIVDVRSAMPTRV